LATENIKPVRQSTDEPDSGLVDRAIRDIRAMIRAQGLKPAAVLPSEAAISAELGVSRAVVREAFRALTALRILDTGNGRRARVASPDAGPISLIVDHTVLSGQMSIQQVLDVRRTLELRTAALAALRRSDAQAATLTATVAQMFDAIDTPDRLRALDIGFHEAIAAASGNPLFGMLVQSFRVITEQTWHIGWHSRATPENRRENIACHGRIATAIAAQNASAAETAMAEHFDSAKSVLLNAGIT
jgi:GntR family transcriptional regulator, transcriptional repressor for pyruvate dehydrogenase complex